MIAIFFGFICGVDAVSISKTNVIPEISEVAGLPSNKIRVTEGGQKDLVPVANRKWSYGRGYVTHNDDRSWNADNWAKRKNLDQTESSETDDAAFRLHQSGIQNEASLDQKKAIDFSIAHSNVTRHTATMGHASGKRAAHNVTNNVDADGKNYFRKERVDNALDVGGQSLFNVAVKSQRNSTGRKSGKAQDVNIDETHTATGSKEFHAHKGSNVEWAATGNDIYTDQVASRLNNAVTSKRNAVTGHVELEKQFGNFNGGIARKIVFGSSSDAGKKVDHPLSCTDGAVDGGATNTQTFWAFRTGARTFDTAFPSANSLSPHLGVDWYLEQERDPALLTNLRSDAVKWSWFMERPTSQTGSNGEYSGAAGDVTNVNGAAVSTDSSACEATSQYPRRTIPNAGTGGQSIEGCDITCENYAHDYAGPNPRECGVAGHGSSNGDDKDTQRPGGARGTAVGTADDNCLVCGGGLTSFRSRWKTCADVESCDNVELCENGDCDVSIEQKVDAANDNIFTGGSAGNPWSGQNRLNAGTGGALSTANANCCKCFKNTASGCAEGSACPRDPHCTTPIQNGGLYTGDSSLPTIECGGFHEQTTTSDNRYDLHINDYLKHKNYMTAPKCTEVSAGDVGTAVNDPVTGTDAGGGNHAIGTGIWEGTGGCVYDCVNQNGGNIEQGSAVRMVKVGGAATGAAAGTNNVRGTVVSSGCTAINGIAGNLDCGSCSANIEQLD